MTADSFSVLQGKDKKYIGEDMLKLLIMISKCEANSDSKLSQGRVMTTTTTNGLLTTNGPIIIHFYLTLNH